MIDKASTIPYYLQVKEALLKDIAEGKYRPGDKIPAEVELCSIYGVSRPTIRQAFDDLEREGLLRREKGRGTFITQPGIRVKTRLTFLAPDFHANLIGRPLAEEFMRLHEDIQINVISAPYEAVHEHFYTEFIHHAGHTDIIMVPFSLMPEYVLGGKLEVLDPYIQESGLDFSRDYLKGPDGRPVIDHTCAFYIPGVGERRFGIPVQNDVYVLLYRKDLFSKYGLQAPRTPDEYAHAARVLTNSVDESGGHIPFGTALNAKRTGADLAEDFIGFLWAFGGDLFDSDLVPIVNSPAGRRALEFYKSLLEFSPPQSVNHSVFDGVKIMAEGDVAMMMNWSSLIGCLENPDYSEVAGKLGYALFPPECPQVAGWELAIPYDSQHKAEAFEFIKFATGASPDVARVYMNQGVIPYWLSIVQDSTFNKRNPCAGVIERAWRKGRGWGRYREARALMEVTSLYGSHALTGVMGVEDALEEMAKVYSTLIKKDVEFRRVVKSSRLHELSMRAMG
ncbi:MAG: extracellular solute-binding protein [Firmicutes bacterium]|nr:extracellular solute-binding protein [Bacillota bacterium]